MTIDLWQAIVIGVLQGATEFLPVSSSGHLVVVPALIGWEPPPLAFDIALHWATALAVAAYFREDWWRMASGLSRAARARSLTGEPEAKLALLLALGTVPAGAVGIGFNDFFERLFGNPAAAAALLPGTGVILIGAEVLLRRSRRRRPDASANGGTAPAVDARRALIVGIAQALAILPGISRSGATISAGIATGLSRDAAARFSFLLATPAIFGAAVLELRNLPESWPMAATVGGMLAAFTVGYLSIGWLLAYVRRRSLLPFAAYVILFGIFALIQLR